MCHGLLLPINIEMWCYQSNMSCYGCCFILLDIALPGPKRGVLWVNKTCFLKCQQSVIVLLSIFILSNGYLETNFCEILIAKAYLSYKCNDQPLVANSIRCPHMASVYLRPVSVLHKRLLVAASMATFGYFAIKTIGSWLKLDSVRCYINVSVFNTLLLTLRWV